jgi:uncharacterized membrane protein
LSKEDSVQQPQPEADEPLEILDRRLASGEINVENYDQLRLKLSSRPAAKLG